jgi:hypothetical protein
MSIRQNFPTTPPSLVLDFANSKTLDPRITFSRTTTATRMNELGLIETVDADVARFDHEYDASTGVIKSLGLLVEDSRVNYNTYTEDPTQWNTANMVSTGNSVTLPTGEVSTTIEYKGETTDANNKFIRPTVSGSAITAGDTWTYSGFYKKGTTNGERYVHIVLQNNSAGEGIGRRFDFDIGNWASSLGLNNVTVADSGFEKYPNGWFRIWMTCTFPSASGAVQTFTRLFTNSTSIPYDTSFSLWGAQLEKAPFYSSYIPNDTGSQKTRNPDTVTMTGDNFSDWYNPSEGTFYVSSSFYADGGAGQLIFQIDNGSNANRNGITFRNELSGNQIRPFDVNYSASPAGFDLWTHTGSVINTDYKTAFALKSNDMAAVTNYPEGSLGLDSSTSRILQEKTTLRLGSGISNISPLNGHISKLTYYPTRLSNDQLQNLTK